MTGITNMNTAALIALAAGLSYQATGGMAEIDEPPGYYDKQENDHTLAAFKMDKAQAKRDRKATRRKEQA